MLPPIGIVVGIYILWVGADHPGGKFQGATVLAAMWLLLMMSGLHDAPAVSQRWVRLALIAGPAVFILVGVLGVFVADAFLAYPEGFAKPLIIVIEVALLPSLAVTLTLLLIGPPQRSGPRPMNAPTLFGLCAAVLGGLRAVRPDRASAAAAQGAVLQPDGQRHLSGLRGHCASWRGSAAWAAIRCRRPLLITAIVVAFAASALAVALMLRLFDETGSSSLSTDGDPAPAKPPAEGDT